MTHWLLRPCCAAIAGSLRALVKEAVKEGVEHIDEGLERVIEGMSTLSLMSQQAYLSVYDTRSQGSRNSNSRQDAAGYYSALSPDTVPPEVEGEHLVRIVRAYSTRL